MRFIPVVASVLVAFSALAGRAPAQIKVGMETERSTFLVYEPINLQITLENNAGFDLLFQDAPGKSWLTFLVTRGDHAFVPPDQKAATPDLKMAAGESAQFKVNVTPRYAMREPGLYRIQAVIDIAGREYLSTPILVTLTTGRRVWSETRPVEGSPRTYSLLRFSPNSSETLLYLRVEDEAQNLVYANNPLGAIVDLEVPQVLFDGAGQVHVLNLTGNSAYRYSRGGADGAILSQSSYESAGGNRPNLVRAGNGVIVSGGRQQGDSTRRERLSEGQGRIVPPAPGAPAGPYAPGGALNPLPLPPGGLPPSGPGGAPQSPPPAASR